MKSVQPGSDLDTTAPAAAGRSAQYSGILRSACPHPSGSREEGAWLVGWDAGWDANFERAWA